MQFVEKETQCITFARNIIRNYGFFPQIKNPRVNLILESVLARNMKTSRYNIRWIYANSCFWFFNCLEIKDIYEKKMLITFFEY